MQTIRIPWKASDEDRARIGEWQRHRAVATRTAYANAEGKTAQELRELLKSRLPDYPSEVGISIVQQWKAYLFARKSQMGR